MNVLYGEKTPTEMNKMTKIYQLMIGKKQINDLYYNEDDARENAKQIAIDTGKTIVIWVAEEIEGLELCQLEWSLNRIVGPCTRIASAKNGVKI